MPHVRTDIDAIGRDSARRSQLEYLAGCLQRDIGGRARRIEDEAVGLRLVGQGNGLYDAEV
jgi:hypothetical protein